MARGIKLPMQAKNGRLVLTGGDAYMAQLVHTGLGDGESDNPFQALALGEFMIFGINDKMSDGQIRERVKATFATLVRDQLAQLEDLKFESVDNEKKMFLGYRNLETGKREDIEVPIPPA